ncbi:hypothetical protein VHEMI07984 [[Torrubiella] hemipterigena]|uniref:Peptidase S1 domain-containing protein n=1 Tax=[Torrubiella] hemipterigena TaxID=1531966 RepID=A0A0A1TC23_9HYPO|nr:hypothetical protein VHEMI07984 [[Torrubiella] hemipterigena]
MKNQLALLVLASTATALPALNGRAGEIVGGESAKIEDFPYQVDLRVRDSANCGGTIVSERFVVTAAHCALGYSTATLSIRVGNAINGKGTSYKVKKAYVHPKYTDEKDPYDAAVLEFDPPIKFTNTVKPIALADAEPSPGTDAVVSGWGSTSRDDSKRVYPDDLHSVHVPIFDHDKCNKDYGANPAITADMICAGFDEGVKDACYGDSGGPLVVGGKLVGIVSFGKGCASPNYPGVYASVASPEIRSFIKQVTGL